MSVETPPNLNLDNVEIAVLDDLVKRVGDIDHAYRSLAEKMGQLYMKADEAGLGEVTALLDKPMRNASDNHQSFVALLDEVRTHRSQRD